MSTTALTLNHTITVNADGLWSKTVAQVQLTAVTIEAFTELPLNEFLDSYMSCTVMFDKSTWGTSVSGYIYTDSCIKQVQDILAAELGISGLKLEWSECGMQGDDYMHFDMPAHIGFYPIGLPA